MSHYAKIENNLVTAVIVADADFIATQQGQWIQTSYNTIGNTHRLGGTPLRKNYAGRGYTYDSGRDAFIPPKEYDSWILNETSCLYEAPTPYPNDGKRYTWSELTLQWIEINNQGTPVVTIP